MEGAGKGRSKAGANRGDKGEEQTGKGGGNWVLRMRGAEHRQGWGRHVRTSNFRHTDLITNLTFLNSTSYLLSGEMYIGQPFLLISAFLMNVPESRNGRNPNPENVASFLNASRDRSYQMIHSIYKESAGALQIIAFSGLGNGWIL
jgi:hypothetical protein